MYLEPMNMVNSITGGISAFNAVKNRNKALSEALPTWINSDYIDEIIIVDWDSDKESVQSIVDKYNSDKITLVKVSNEPKWILSHAFNLAAQFTSKKQIIKLDTDIKVTDDFFENCVLSKDVFYTGSWELARNENEAYLNGTVFLWRDDFFKIKGYNERITSYGWDDDDLYNRLKKLGLNREFISPDLLTHIPHDNLSRTQHQDIEDLDANIIKNRQLTRRQEKWGETDSFTEFVAKKTDGGYTCERKSEAKM